MNSAQLEDFTHCKWGIFTGKKLTVTNYNFGLISESWNTTDYSGDIIGNNRLRIYQYDIWGLLWEVINGIYESGMNLNGDYN